MVNRNRGSTSQSKQLLKATKNLEEKKEKVNKSLEREKENVGKRKLILKKPKDYAKTIEKAKDKVNTKTRHYITALETDLTLQGLHNNLQKCLLQLPFHLFLFDLDHKRCKKKSLHI